MAIYYIDPHTTVNGTGTYASPWSFSTATRTGITSNDEIRIKGVALTSLLTATSYTATVTNNYQLTITAGGGLGADWVSGSVGYLPAFDTFFLVYSVSVNTIQLYTTTSMLPILDWSTTTVTLRKVDTTTYPASTTSTAYYINGTAALTGITVSDCWTSATTRVTDGTVKTLIQSSTTSATTLYVTSSNLSSQASGWNLDLSNTHVMCGRTTTSGYVDCALGAMTNSTLTINQLFSWGSTGPGISATLGSAGNTITVNKLCNYNGFGSTVNTTNSTYNITNLVAYNGAIFGTGGSPNALGVTFNITNYIFNVVSNAGMIDVVNSPKTSINISGYIDQYGPTSPSYLVYGYGDTTLNIGASVVYYYNKRVATKTSFTALTGYIANAVVGINMYVPTVTLANSWTYTDQSNMTGWQNGTSKAFPPQDYNLIYPVDDRTAGTPYGTASGTNALVTFKDGTAPFEILSVYGNGYYVNASSNVNFPIVTTDAAVYRTTGPSLKSNLNTRNATVWVTTNNNYSKATKTIRIPCTSGQSYTVSGYIRCDDAAYATGDCRVGIWFNDAEVTGQNMTTACINAWEQFTLTFTASQTAEYVFTWSMYYANGAKSYWLDDLTIV